MADQTTPRPDILAIASDYDGTLAEDDIVPARTIAALERFRTSGRRLILVSGRHLPDLKQVFDHLHLFDVAILENGGLLYFPQTNETRLLAAPPSDQFIARLRERGVDELAIGQTIVATHIGHYEAIRATIEEMGLDLAIILNTDALMVLPRGIDKASGLKAGLAALSLAPMNVAAIGDAENDIVFLQACGYAVAVANALPQVKAVADKITKGARGYGVEEFIAELLKQV